jgi:hypothetical protein
MWSNRNLVQLIYRELDICDASALARVNRVCRDEGARAFSEDRLREMKHLYTSLNKPSVIHIHHKHTDSSCDVVKTWVDGPIWHYPTSHFAIPRAHITLDICTHLLHKRSKLSRSDSLIPPHIDLQQLGIALLRVEKSVSGIPEFVWSYKLFWKALKYGVEFKDVPVRYRDDKIRMRAILLCPTNFQQMSEDNITDEMAIAAISQRSYLIDWLPYGRQTSALRRLAFELDPGRLQDLTDATDADYLRAVATKGSLIVHVPNESITLAMAIYAVKYNPDLLLSLPERYYRDPVVQRITLVQARENDCDPHRIIVNKAAHIRELINMINQTPVGTKFETRYVTYG